MANKGGRPAKYTDPKKFDAAVDAYVKDCAEKGEPLTITGLALALGFVNKCSLYEYEQVDGFTDSVKRARAIVEASYEKRLMGPHATGPIFALKNFGWRDNIDLGGGINVTKIEETIVDPADPGPEGV